MPMALHGKNRFEVAKINVRALHTFSESVPLRQYSTQHTMAVPIDAHSDPLCLRCRALNFRLPDFCPALTALLTAGLLTAVDCAISR